MRILTSLDLDGNQRVDYLEFIAATMKGVSRGLSDAEMQTQLMQAFKHFDKDDTGFITMEVLKVRYGPLGMNLPPGHFSYTHPVNQ